jgi:hypothetical protein
VKDLRKIYLIKKDKDGRATMGPTNPMVEAFLEKVFVHIGETYDGAPLDNSMPVFKFGAKELTMDLQARGIVSDRNLYSPLSLVSRASSKKGLYRTLRGDYMPRSYFTGEEAAAHLQFPILVKPINGWAGKGVRIVNSRASLPYSSGLVYQEHLKIAHEYRFTMVKGQIIFVAERVPSNEKAKALRDGRESNVDEYSRNKFIWKPINMCAEDNAGSWFRKAKEIAVDVMRRIGLGVAGLDIAVTTEGKVYLIECNTSMGMTHDQSIRLYKAIFEDWYGRPVDSETEKVLNLFGEILEEARKRYIKGKY